MISQAISSTPRIIFMGAGASRPLNKMLMGEFVSSLRRKYTDNVLLNRITENVADLEFLLEELEQLKSKSYLASFPNTATRPRAADLAMPPVSMKTWSGIYDLANEATALVRTVQQEIFNHYRVVDGRKASELLCPLFDREFRNEHPLVVFTTNYDVAVEEACASSEKFRLIDGFRYDQRSQTSVWNREEFDRIENKDGEGSLVLFKLHGSTNWFQEGSQIKKSAVSIFAGDDERYRHVLIYPATRKVAITDPYFTAYDYLQKCLESAESCTAIGYSFRDYDTLMRFKSAFLTNKKLTLTVIDSLADQLVDQLKMAGIPAVPVAKLFETTSTVDFYK